MTFRVGQKVVCVDDRDVPRGQLFVNWNGTPMKSNGNMGGLTKGFIYTVAAINCDYHMTLVLEEIDRPGNGRDPGFLASRFRPIVERKTDISIFTQMLNPSKRRVDA